MVPCYQCEIESRQERDIVERMATERLLVERDEARLWAQRWRDNYLAAGRGNYVMFPDPSLPWEQP